MQPQCTFLSADRTLFSGCDTEMFTKKWIEGGNYELCIEDVRDEIWDMVKPVDPLKVTLADLLACKQGGTVASMLIDVRGSGPMTIERIFFKKRKSQKKNDIYMEMELATNCDEFSLFIVCFW